MLYYLRSALPDTAHRRVELIQRKTGEPIQPQDLTDLRLIVVGAGLTEDRVSRLRTFLETEGDALWVLKESSHSPDGLRQLLRVDSLIVTEAKVKDFSLLGRIDLEHPLFAPFADARFADFSKIHFWRHRELHLPDSPETRVVASFDNGDPFLIEKPIGQNVLRIMTSSWAPD